MSEQQPQEQRTKRRAGGINRYATLGKAIIPEHSETEISEDQNVPAPERLDVSVSEIQNVQELKHPEVKASNKRERERHTIYLPPELSEWVKIKAVKTKREISELVTEAIERYREQEERRKY